MATLRVDAAGDRAAVVAGAAAAGLRAGLARHTPARKIVAASVAMTLPVFSSDQSALRAKAGVMEEGRRLATRLGSPQGATISPLLANVYLHYAYDLWVHQWRKRHARGEVIVVRYADDAVVGFEREEDARGFLVALRERLDRFRLELHPDKTKLVRFR